MNSSLRLVLALNFVFIALGFSPLYKIYTTLFFNFSSPVLVRAADANAILSGFFKSLANFPRTFKAVEVLKNQQALNGVLTSRINILTAENNLLRSQLKIAAGRSLGKMVLARVSGRISGDTLILNAGQKEGVAVGNLVLFNEALVGRISQVRSGSSELLLTVSPLSSFEVLDSNSGARGVVVGEFGSGLKLSKVLPSQNLNEGDILVEPSLGLVLGKVARVAAEGTNIFKEAEVSVLYDPAVLSNVFVLLSE